MSALGGFGVSVLGAERSRKSEAKVKNFLKNQVKNPNSSLSLSPELQKTPPGSRKSWKTEPPLKGDLNFTFSTSKKSKNKLNFQVSFQLLLPFPFFLLWGGANSAQELPNPDPEKRQQLTGFWEIFVFLMAESNSGAQKSLPGFIWEFPHSKNTKKPNKNTKKIQENQELST